MSAELLDAIIDKHSSKTEDPHTQQMADIVANEYYEQKTKLYPADEWCEDMHDVLWWRFPVEQAPYVGSPLDTDWNEPWPLGGSHADYHTHFQIINVPDIEEPKK